MNTFNEKGGGKRSVQKEKTRQDVLAAARDEFEEAGYEGANLRSMARRAGVSPGTILHHFQDKSDLLHAALYDDLEETLGRALSSKGRGLLKELVRLTRALFTYYEKRPTLSRTLLKESLFAKEPWAGRFREQAGTVHVHVVSLVEEAKKTGELGRDVDGGLFALTFLSCYYFALISWVQGAGVDPVKLVERQMKQQIGVAGEKR